MKEQARPIIVKRIIQGGGHHGGAWKVANADFVTAMMAFFLLLWLLNVTTDEQKRGIADYFAPTSASRQQSGSGGILGGQTLNKDGARVGDASKPTVVIELTPPPVRDTGEDETQEGRPEKETADEDGKSEQESEKAAGDDGEKGEEKETEERPPTEEELLNKLAEQEQKEFAEAEAKLRQAMEDLPELEELKRHVIIDNTPERLRIQIVDQDGRSMFPSGSAGMHEHTAKILEQVAKVVLNTENNLSITGHTDSIPFRTGGDSYGNWELSSDRANASRRALMGFGIPANRIARVSGLADTEPLIREDSAHPSNRRISVVLLRQAASRPGAPAAPSEKKTSQ